MDTQRPLDLGAVAERSDFKILSAKRNRLGIGLAAAMTIIYFTFICLVAFAPATLAQPIAAGSAISTGIVVGVGVMVAGLVLTAIYVISAARFDVMVEILKEATR